MASSPEPEDTLVPEEEDLQNAICKLTSTERDIITEVLQRDQQLRSQEKERLGFVICSDNFLPSVSDLACFVHFNLF